MTDGIIVAPATAWGVSAIAVVRLSGPSLVPWVEQLARPRGIADWRPGVSRRVDFLEGGEVFDDGLATWWAAPRSYTGEDCVELSCHGNPLLVQRLIDAALAAGARLAEAGAFTRRAVEHGKLDLVRAEAVLQATTATTAEGLAIARSGLDGRLTAAIDALTGPLRELAAALEASLDHPEDVGLSDTEVLDALHALAERCRTLAATERLGRLQVQGARVALVGAVNAGKSSLFNALLGRGRALVHDQPGTTRDVLELPCTLAGLRVTLMDTAGERVTDDPVEAAGLALARELVADADAVIVVLRARPDGPDAVERTLLERTASWPRLVVLNQIDRVPEAPAPRGAHRISAKTGDGLDQLGPRLRDVLVGETPGEARLVIASARQRDLLLSVGRHLDVAVEGLQIAGAAVCAEELTEALSALDALTGADTRERVLDALFARFCIGK